MESSKEVIESSGRSWESPVLCARCKKSIASVEEDDLKNDPSNLRHHSITVAGISSDGDSRLLRAMSIESCLGTSDHRQKIIDENGTVLPGFHASFPAKILFVQDPVHKVVKLRTRLVSNSIIMPMGDYVVSVGHIKTMMQTVSKDKHCLTEKDMSVKDKMNFPSAMKLCDPKIWTLLEEHVPGSEATRAFLKVQYYAASSYLSQSISAKDRIYYIWYCVYFLRLWRAWIGADSNYSISDNFITRNAYVCIELNAHSLVSAIIQCRDDKTPQLFLPWLFESQTCESFFRELRSMTTTLCTMVNFTMLDCIHQIARIQLQADIAVTKFEPDKHLKFPRINHLNASFECQDVDVLAENLICSETCALPNNAEIVQVMNMAKRDTYLLLCTLGVNIDIEVPDRFPLPCLLRSNNQLNLAIEINDEEAEFDDGQVLFSSNVSESEVDRSKDKNSNRELLQDLTVLSTVQGHLELKDYSSCVTFLKETSPFTVVKDSTGRETVVRKSSICWLLNEGTGHLSSDRLQRVRETEYDSYRKSNPQHIEISDYVERCSQKNIGDWTVFERMDSDKCLLGLLLGFGYLNEKTRKATEYSSNYANIDGNKKKIGVLCQWFTVLDNGYLALSNDFAHGYLSIEKYKLTVPNPVITEAGLSLNGGEYRKTNYLF